MGITLMQLLLIAIFGFFVKIDRRSPRAFGYIANPILIGLIVGSILGNPLLGAQTGALLFFAYAGIVEVGVTAVADPEVASLIAVPIVITQNLAPAAAIAISVAPALVGQQLTTLMYSICSGFMHIADRWAGTGETRGFFWLNLSGYILWGLVAVIPIVLFLGIGAEAVTAAINAVPAVIWKGLTTAGDLMATVGVAMLMYVSWNPIYIPAYLFGYALAAFAKIGLVGTAIAGIGLIGSIYLLRGMTKK